MGEHKVGATVLREDSLRIQGIEYEKNKGTRAEADCLGSSASKANFLKNNCDAHLSVSWVPFYSNIKEMDFISKEWLSRKHIFPSLVSETLPLLLLV